MRHASIGPIAVHFPENFETNDDLAKIYPDWNLDIIGEKTGIQKRYIADPHQCASDLGVLAAEKLFQQHNIDPDSIDFLLLCTQTPDYPLPTTACLMQNRLGLRTSAGALDFNLGCSGFVYGLDVIQAFMSAQGLRHGLLFTADPYSKVIDPKDYNTELLFGDAAAVTYIAENPVFVSGKSTFCTNARLSHSIKVDEETRLLSMLGNNVFKFAVTKVPEQVEKCLELNGLGKNDVDLYLMHQGSKYIVDNLVPALGVDAARVPFLAAETGNTVSSSIPLMLEQYMETDEKIILISGFGVGLSWATSVLERT